MIALNRWTRGSGAGEICVTPAFILTFSPGEKEHQSYQFDLRATAWRILPHVIEIGCGQLSLSRGKRRA